MGSFVFTEPIFDIFSANYATDFCRIEQFTRLVHSWMFCVNVALLASKLTEPFMTKQTHIPTYIHITFG